MIRFEKYKSKGAYHWRDYEKKNQYGMHARFVANEWVEKIDGSENMLLDVGAGDGLITWLFQQNGFTAIGIDDSVDGVNAAKTKGVNIQLGDVYDMSFLTRFDIVYFGDTIEHLEYPVKALEVIRDNMMPGGFLYVVTPPARPDGVLQDKYHYREYTPEQLVEEVTTVPEFQLIGDVIVKPEWVRMYAKFQLMP